MARPTDVRQLARIVPDETHERRPGSIRDLSRIRVDEEDRTTATTQRRRRSNPKASDKPRRSIAELAGVDAADLDQTRNTRRVPKGRRSIAELAAMTVPEGEQ
jgi:hypothetical protein